MDARVYWVDYAKAIGIILAVYGHVARGLYKYGIKIPEHTFILVDSIVYSFHMPLFFFLSGLFFHQSLSRFGEKKLLFNKIDTIIYPYLIWSIIQGTIEASLSAHTNGNTTFTEVFTLWEPRAQFWFLYALFLVFATATLIYHFTPERMSAAVFALAALLYTNASAAHDLPALEFICNNLVFFILGIIFTRYNLIHHLSSLNSVAITSAIFIAGQYLFHGYLSKIYTNKGIDSLILACISILFIASLSINLSKNPKNILAHIGASSMAIYLMHILMGSGTRIILSKALKIESPTIHVVIGCIAGIFLPLLALKIINTLKIPFVFSAPASKALDYFYNTALQLRRRQTGQ